MTNGDGLDVGAGLAPEVVERADFNTVRRGYEREQVHSRLRAAAAEIRRLYGLVAALQARIAEFEAIAPERLETARAVEALGDEAARVLQAARDAARERLERAEAESDDITAQAEVAAAAIVEQGREQGRELVVEARSLRERILTDLAYKRHAHRVEVEQLRVIRDRLLEAVSICREGLDGWIADLAQAGPKAAAAAERAGLRVAAEPEPTVGQMEAEIQAARLAEMPLETESGQADSDDQDADAADGPEPEEDPEAVVEPVDADADGPEDAGPVELIEYEELDELAEEEPDEPDRAGEPEPSEYVEIVGYQDGPPERSGGPAVGLYDVEAESDFERDAGTGQMLEHEPEVEARWAPVTDGSPEPAPQAAAASDADVIFARLRSITSLPATEQPPAEASPETAGEESSEAPGEASEPDDLVGAARAVAVGGIARRLKRLVVDEQGELLDAIRRSGSRALRGAVSADAAPYTRAALVPLQDFASDIDVSIDDIDLKAASAAIVSVLVEPVRSRLGELADDTGDPDELARAVRSIYRESRSRRAEAAAEAALAAGWPETVS